MIRVTVELCSAVTGRTTMLGVAKICNDVAGTVRSSGVLGDYNVQLFDKAGRLWKTIKINDFPRKRLLAWDLLYRVLQLAVGSRNK